MPRALIKVRRLSCCGIVFSPLLCMLRSPSSRGPGTQQVSAGCRLPAQGTHWRKVGTRLSDENLRQAADPDSMIVGLMTYLNYLFSTFVRLFAESTFINKINQFATLWQCKFVFIKILIFQKKRPPGTTGRSLKHNSRKLKELIGKRRVSSSDYGTFPKSNLWHCAQ